MPQKKKQEKSPEKELSEREATKIIDEEFKTITIWMLKDIREGMNDISENLNKDQ